MDDHSKRAAAASSPSRRELRRQKKAASHAPHLPRNMTRRVVDGRRGTIEAYR